MTYQVLHDLTLNYFLNLILFPSPPVCYLHPSSLLFIRLTYQDSSWLKPSVPGIYSVWNVLLFPRNACFLHLNLKSKAILSERLSLITFNKAHFLSPPVALVLIPFHPGHSTEQNSNDLLCVFVSMFIVGLLSALWWLKLCVSCSLGHFQSVFGNQPTDLQLWEGRVKIWIIQGKFT